MKNVETYKGVKLSGIRTEKMIDTIIENRDNMGAVELAELVGLSSFRSIVGILKALNHNMGTISKYKKSQKLVKIPVKTSKNTFNNHKGSGKDKARNLIAAAIMETKVRNSNVLTLPADSWIMEKNILKQKDGYKFTAVERDKETYQRMCRNLIQDQKLLNSVISTVNKSIGEVVVNDGEDTYSNAILDYCGFIDSFYNEIDDILKRKLVKNGGYIAITLAENDRMLNNPLQENNLSNEYIRNCCSGEEINGAKVTNDLVNILTFTNKGYKIVSKFKYRDKTAKMLLFIIQRTN